MSLQVDKNFLKLMNLHLFKENRPGVYSFRCPICGDSKKSTSKKRGYAIKDKKGSGLYVYCHNCHWQGSFSYFLKIQDPSLFDRYREEIRREKLRGEKIEHPPETIKNKFQLIKSPLLYESFKSEKGREYLFKRCVTDLDGIYFTSNFQKYINKNYVKKYEKEIEEDRVVFTLYNINNDLIGFQSRSLNRGISERYLTVRLDESENLIWYNKVNKNEIVFATEGIFDAIVLKNSIAFLNSNPNIEFLKSLFPKLIIILDNEPRNKHIVNQYNRIANMNNVGLFIWPSFLKYKDINELYIDVKGKVDVNGLILKHSYFSVLEKKMRVVSWQN